MMNCIKPSTTTMDAIEPRMVSTLFPRGVGAESGGTRDDGPAATLDEIASIETKGGCSSEVIQRKSEGFLATEPGASKNKQKTIKMIACVDQTAGLEAGKSASEDGGSGRSVVSHGTTALLPLASGLFKGFQGGGLEQKGPRVTGVLDNPRLVSIEAWRMGHDKLGRRFLARNPAALERWMATADKLERQFLLNASLQKSRKTTQDGFKDSADFIATETTGRVSLAAIDNAILHRATNNASIQDDSGNKNESEEVDGARPVLDPASKQRDWPSSSDGVLISVFHPNKTDAGKKKKNSLSLIKCIIAALCIVAFASLVNVARGWCQATATSPSSSSSQAIELPAFNTKPLSLASSAAPQPFKAIAVIARQVADADTLAGEESTKSVMKVTFEYFELEAMGHVSVGIICELEASPAGSIGDKGILFASRTTSLSDVTLGRGIDGYTNQELISVGFGGGRFSITAVCEDARAMPQSSSLLSPQASHHRTMSEVFQVASVLAIPTPSLTLSSSVVPARCNALDPRRTSPKIPSLDSVRHIYQDDSQALVVWQPNKLSPKLVIDGTDVARDMANNNGLIAVSEPSNKTFQCYPGVRVSTLDRFFTRAVSSTRDRTKALAVWQPQSHAMLAASIGPTPFLEVEFDYWEKEPGDVLVSVDCSVKIVNLPSLMNGTLVLQDHQEPILFVSQTVCFGDVILTRFRDIASEFVKVDFASGRSSLTVVCSEPSSNWSNSSESNCVLPTESNGARSRVPELKSGLTSPQALLQDSLCEALAFEMANQVIFFLLSRLICALWLLFGYCYATVHVILKSSRQEQIDVDQEADLCPPKTIKGILKGSGKIRRRGKRKRSRIRFADTVTVREYDRTIGMIPRPGRPDDDIEPPHTQYISFYPLGLDWTHGDDYQVDMSRYGHKQSKQRDYRYWTSKMRLELLLGHGFRMRKLRRLDSRACAMHDYDNAMARAERPDDGQEEND